MNLNSEKNKKLFLILLSTIFTGLFLSSVLTEDIKQESNSSLDKYAQEMVALCKDAPHRPTCYEENLPDLTSEISTEQIFDVIRLIRQYDPEYLYCHVLAHELGEYDMSLDPENWLDVLAKAPPDGLCSNGYTHGAALARFNDDVLSKEELVNVIPDFSIACEEREGWSPTDLQKAICYHGLGHVLIHLTDAEVNPSLEVCEVVALKDDGRDYRQLCVEGIYMQLFQPLEPEDFALVDKLEMVPSRDNIADFCANESNNQTQFDTCWREAWPMFYEDLFTAEGVDNYCGQLEPGVGREKCYISAFTINGRQYLGDPDKLVSLCNSVDEQYQGMCFARGANTFPEEDANFIPKAVDICNRAESTSAQDECFSFLANTAAFNFHRGSESFIRMCNALPERWQEDCLE